LVAVFELRFGRQNTYPSLHIYIDIYMYIEWWWHWYRYGNSESPLLINNHAVRGFNECVTGTNLQLEASIFGIVITL